MSALKDTLTAIINKAEADIDSIVDNWITWERLFDLVLSPTETRNLHTYGSALETRIHRLAQEAHKEEIEKIQKILDQAAVIAYRRMVVSALMAPNPQATLGGIGIGTSIGAPRYGVIAKSNTATIQTNQYTSPAVPGMINTP